ncbi:type II toxin-antitoxin system RelE/ParE family toxin [Geminicoccus roseus]|uniref:type II toxin-antitoxin system RelE/ParE family toxin n=1 Tax=Geminicoccus roseus TaxID=404900 RepID=UPI00040AEFA6|nr:type II toxin-antitoxin system RelE/ParE family toxin [Geminicoccus roseus]
MSGFLLSPAAQVDLDGIWEYTAKRWGQDQAVTYIRSIRDACQELAAGIRISRPVDIRDGYRKASVGSHVLFFKNTDTGQIAIIRILHQRMDVNRHL